MERIRHVVVFDADDIEAESEFWAAMLDGIVLRDDPSFHPVIDAEGNWVLGVQHAPGHIPPDWPDGEPQQAHIDFHVTDPDASHRRAMELGARLLQDADDPDAGHGHRVYADPAGHPFCLGWGHGTQEQLTKFLADYSPPDAEPPSDHAP